MADPRFSHLLSPGRIGTMELRNRIALTAMGVSFAEDDGGWGDRARAYFEERARGGAGLLISGATGVSWPVGGVQPKQFAISEDRFIPGIAATAEAVHRHGAKLAIQLHHAGPNSIEDMLNGRPVYVPTVPKPAGGGYMNVMFPDEIARSGFGRVKSLVYREMSHDDIRAVVDDFAAAAVRAVQAGVDGVEVHGGHGYVISSFLSAATNKREDEYGGLLENRARLMTEVLTAIRAAVGRDYPVWVKLDTREMDRPGGITIKDAMATAKLAEQAGADAITASAYHSTEKGKMDAGSHTPFVPGSNIPFAAQIKTAVTVPVIAMGRIEQELGDATIRDGRADFIAMGRKLLADPDLPRKLTEGRQQDIRPCIYCNTCISAIFTADSSHCAVNPELGFEYLNEGAVGVSGKHIVVIGGGPGGMEAARRLDALGNKVTLIEAGERLGGTLQFAGLAYEPNARLLHWLRRAIEQSGVEVRLRTEATVEMIRALHPDAVLVATGARRDMPAISGAELPHVYSGNDLRALLLGETNDEVRRKTGLGTRLVAKVAAATGASGNLDLVRQATKSWMPLGDRIVIIGGELVGLELAEFLMERGRTVRVVDDATHFGAGLQILRRLWVLDELARHGVGLHKGAADIRIVADAVTFRDQNGVVQSVAADHVIVAKGATGDTALADALRASGMDVRVFGDATGVGYIEGAMRGAAEAVRAI